MNKWMNRLIGLLIVLAVLGACNRKVAILSSDKDLASFSTDDFSFDYFQSKVKIRFNSPDQNLSSAATIRMKSDSIIWISLAPALGIELARGIITPDTIIFIDRFNREVYHYNFDQLSRMFNFPVNFKILQSVVVGNMPLPLQMGDMADKEMGKFILTQQRGPIQLVSEVDNSSRKLEKMLMTEQPSGSQMRIQYSDFNKLDSEVFPNTGSIVISYKTSAGVEETKVQIEHNKVERLKNPISFPFSVPDKYGKN
jgi:hypothetical protein